MKATGGGGDDDWSEGDQSRDAVEIQPIIEEEALLGSAEDDAAKRTVYTEAPDADSSAGLAQDAARRQRQPDLRDLEQLLAPSSEARTGKRVHILGAGSEGTSDGHSDSSLLGGKIREEEAGGKSADAREAKSPGVPAARAQSSFARPADKISPG
ncbi:hypothetical protein MKZ38_009818 [Zalerion maritima]|uniref:Uncharacterized protein n=1 Tax=Zalerion maritima TaxID=339359 RepID=A0AAD5RYQ3_9PEZI|nr:hypothetical protein MKZ38_009818 [Zalerion maritima]